MKQEAERLWDGFLTDRAPPLTEEELSRFRNKRILITGAGGFLGSALARALGRLPVRRMLLLDIAEYGLYRLEQDLRMAKRAPEIALVVGNLRDEALLHELFTEHAPEIVFHAAALKHVPLMENNVPPAAETNALGTKSLLDVAMRGKVETFIHLSTDKAVEPISVMGATKRIAEQIVLSAQGRSTLVNAVRLCNVLGSTGSVAPLFARQIARGGPVTVTHPETTRYFISRKDAVCHLLRSATLTETTGLTVPVLDGPRRVEDLANYMLRQSQSIARTMEIAHTGLRRADKLHEQLVSSSESSQVLDGNPSVLAIRSPFDPSVLQATLSELRFAVEERDRPRLMRAIQRAVPEYRSQQASLKQEREVGA